MVRARSTGLMAGGKERKLTKNERKRLKAKVGASIANATCSSRSLSLHRWPRPDQPRATSRPPFALAHGAPTTHATRARNPAPPRPTTHTLSRAPLSLCCRRRRRRSSRPSRSSRRRRRRRKRRRMAPTPQTRRSWPRRWRWSTCRRRWRRSRAWRTSRASSRSLRRRRSCCR